MAIELAVENEEVATITTVDYEELYHVAFSRLTFLHDAVEKAQQDLEAIYLRQTDNTMPHLQVMKKQE